MRDTYESEQAALKERVKTLKSEIGRAKEQDDKILDFLILIHKYRSFEELTPEIFNCFVEKTIISETEWYADRKMQEVKIIYKFVWAIRLPQYDVS